MYCYKAERGLVSVSFFVEPFMPLWFKSNFPGLFPSPSLVFSPVQAQEKEGKGRGKGRQQRHQRKKSVPLLTPTGSRTTLFATFRRRHPSSTATMSPNNERTFIMIKPDGVHRNLVGDIIKRFEQKGFKLVAMKFMQVRGRKSCCYCCSRCCC